MPTPCWRAYDLHRHFEDVFDIIAAELEPKPSPQTYDRFLGAHGVDAAKAAMFEDLARNLAVPHALGMTTVLVVPENTREVFREGWELEGRDAPHVDHVTDNLVGIPGIDRSETQLPGRSRCGDDLLNQQDETETNDAGAEQPDHGRLVGVHRERAHSRHAPQARSADWIMARPMK